MCVCSSNFGQSVKTVPPRGELYVWSLRGGCCLSKRKHI